MWLRSILAEDHGVDCARVKWVTFEEPHVAGFRDPPNVERALPDARLKGVIADPAAAADAWCAKHGALQINHMVAVKESLARCEPDAVREVYRLLAESREAADAPELNPFGWEANRRNLEVAIEQTWRQGPIARRYTVDELI